jgi:hypothetical protein
MSMAEDKPDTAPAASGRPAAKVAPRQYAGGAGYQPGDTAPKSLFGHVLPDGSVEATGGNGSKLPDEGRPATVLVQEGDTVTSGHLAAAERAGVDLGKL